MADFVSAEITQEIIDAKNKLNQQADRAESIINSWDNAAGGDMNKFVYDPQGVQADAFNRSNMTGEQSISTVTGLQSILDSKVDESAITNLADDVQSNTTAINTKASTSDLNQGLATKQDELDSGTNIKTINGESLLGSGDITITGGGDGAVDSVNGQTGVVELSAGDIDETGLRIYFTPNEKTKLAGLENYTLPSDVVQDADYVATENDYTTVEKNKLAGIEAGAEVNTVSTTDLAAKEDSLGNPATDGQLLSSTTAGVRTWVDAPAGGGGGFAPTSIAITDLVSTATLAALGSGEFIYEQTTVEPSFTDSRLPMRTSGSYNWYFSIKMDATILDITCTVIPTDAATSSVAVGGVFKKVIRRSWEAARIPWTIISGNMPETSAIKPDLTDFDSTLASLLSGAMVVGVFKGANSITGANGGLQARLEVEIDALTGTGEPEWIFIKAMNAWSSFSGTNGLDITYRGLKYTGFDSGWNTN